MSETITYIEPAEAVEILAERLATPGIVDSVRRYLGDEIPDTRLLEAPSFLLRDYVARGRNLDVAYARETLKVGGQPYWGTFDDQYSRTNPAKASVVRPVVQLPDGILLDDRRIIDGADQAGGMMSRRTIFGTTLAEYHQGLRKAVFANAGLEAALPNVFDMTPWYVAQAKRFGYKEGDSLAASFMLARTALGVLCAQSVNYEQRHYDSGFMDTVLPTIERVREDLGLEPVFVQRPSPPLKEVICLRGISANRVSLHSEGRGKRQQIAVRGIAPDKEA